MTTLKHPRLAWSVLKLMAIGLLAAAFITGVSASSTASAPPPPAAQRSAPNWLGQGALPAMATQVETGDGATTAPASLPGIVRVIDSGDGCRVILAAEAAEHEQHANGMAAIIECHNVTPESTRLPLASSPDDVPPAPVLLSPTDNSTLDTLLPRYFVDTTVSNIQISPRIQVSRDPGFGQLSAGVTFCGWTRPQSQFDFLTSENLLPNTRYYWRARSAYGDACSNPNLPWGAWSPTWSFVTGSNGIILPAPALVSPTDGSVVPVIRPSLTWQAVSGAVGTQIEGRSVPPLINPDDFGWGTTWELGVATSAQVYRDLTIGQTYEWYVRFRNDYAWGNQSERWRFTINPTLTINFSAGAPGSYFLLTGDGYPPNAHATVTANGVAVGTVPIDTGGEFSFRLETPDADPGVYVVTASVNPAASTNFRLSLDQPIRPLEGSGSILNIPSGIAFDHEVFLPVVWR